MTGKRLKKLPGATGTTLRQVISQDGSFLGLVGTIRDFLANGYFPDRLRSCKRPTDDWCFVTSGLDFYFGKTREEALKEEERMCQN